MYDLLPRRRFREQHFGGTWRVAFSLVAGVCHLSMPADFSHVFVGELDVDGTKVFFKVLREHQTRQIKRNARSQTFIFRVPGIGIISFP